MVLLAFVLATGYRTATVAVRRNRPVACLMLAYFVVGLVYNFTEAAFFRMMAPAWIGALLAMTRVPGGPSSVKVALKREEREIWFDTAPAASGGGSRRLLLGAAVEGLQQGRLVHRFGERCLLPA